MNDKAFNNIKTISDLMELLRNQGMGEIEPFLDIEHNPTNGDMYENLTKDVMS